MSTELSLYVEKRIINLLLFSLGLKEELPYSNENFILSNQIARTIRRFEGIYKKAREMERGEDFISVMKEVKRGASETRYWIRVLKKSNAQLLIISEFEDETEELIKIFLRIQHFRG